jgi:hypothetical protein
MQCTMYFFEIIMECVLIKSSEVRVCLLGVQTIQFPLESLPSLSEIQIENRAPHQTENASRYRNG